MCSFVRLFIYSFVHLFVCSFVKIFLAAKWIISRHLCLASCLVVYVLVIYVRRVVYNVDGATVVPNGNNSVYATQTMMTLLDRCWYAYSDAYSVWN